jgi:hypothetical protein
MSDFVLGIAPEHRVALVCALLTPLFVGLGGRIVAGHAGLRAPWAMRLSEGWRSADATTRWGAWSLLIAAVVHLALPLGHPDWTPLSLAFVASGGCAAWLARRAVLGRPWRRWTGLLCTGCLLGYAVAVGSGHEDADQVGLATAAVELALLALLSGRLRWRFATMAIVFLFGTGIWLVVLVNHDRHGADAGTAAGAGHVHDDHVDRAQAGFVQHSVGRAPTAAQAKAAVDLAARTKSATLRYRDIAVAEADGYRLTGPHEGLQVHLDQRDHQHDGRILDPQAPEQLVYAIRGGRSVLLGVVYQMPVAGTRGPAVGGSSTRWHAHNICIGLLPPGFGAVNPFGTCPPFTIALTVPEMMHVWVVDPPGGPYAEHLEDAWVTSLLMSRR